jgi:hypothetical protein
VECCVPHLKFFIPTSIFTIFHYTVHNQSLYSFFFQFYKFFIKNKHNFSRKIFFCSLLLFFSLTIKTKMANYVSRQNVKWDRSLDSYTDTSNGCSFVIYSLIQIVQIQNIEFWQIGDFHLAVFLADAMAGFLFG